MPSHMLMYLDLVAFDAVLPHTHSFLGVIGGYNVGLGDNWASVHLRVYLVLVHQPLVEHLVPCVTHTISERTKKPGTAPRGVV